MIVSVVQSAITLIIFFGMLGALVVIHELGHFVTARLAHIRVLEFGLGFPPRARVLRSRGDTLYTLNWLPIGGFVRLEGEDGDSQDPRSFVRARLLTKVLILVAGVAMNVLLAFVIFFGINWLASPTVALQVRDVQADSPARAAGIVLDDRIMAVNDTPFYFAISTTTPAAGDRLRAMAGQTVRLEVVHADGRHETITTTLRGADQLSTTKGALGIAFQAALTGDYVGRPFGDALVAARDWTGQAFRLIADGLGQLANSIVKHPTEAPPVTGPIGIAGQVGTVFWQQGVVFTLLLAGILSANLALVNILPFPPLDGGRVAVLIIKAVAGERVSIRAERLTYLVGFVFLMTFLVWISFFDITAPGRGQ